MDHIDQMWSDLRQQQAPPLLRNNFIFCSEDNDDNDYHGDE